MKTTFLSSDFLAGLRRPFAVCGLIALSALAGCSGDDDDDDDDGLGPSADCIESSSDVWAELGVDEDEVEAIAVGGNESGALSTSDTEFNGFYYDWWVFAVQDDGDVTIEVDPSGFDAYVYLYDGDGNYITEVDEGFEGDVEEIVEDLEEGCYIIEVTSFDAEETGSYSVSVD